MSQHFFETVHEGEATTVLMGWDRPLQGYFMVIQKDSDGNEPFWSNLYCEPTHPTSLAVFLNVLKSFEIIIPQTMIAKIEEDKANNVGNKEMFHY